MTTEQKFTLGEHSANRSYFERGASFLSPASEAIIVAYEKASRAAQRSAKAAMQSGAMEQIRRAQWDEAVASTLECVLSGMAHFDDAGGEYSDTEIELPGRPEFK